MTSLGLLTAIIVCSWLISSAEGRAGDLDEERIGEIAEMLAQQPAGVGRPGHDRDAWEKLAHTEALRAVLRRAEQLNAKPLPDLPDDLYLDFSRTGNRIRWERVSLYERRGRLTPLVLAECAEWRGRFVGPIEELVRAVCSERTWVMPAHDGALKNFRGEVTNIDLASSALGWQLALTDYVLGDRLDPGVRQQLGENVMRRVIDPALRMYRGQQPMDWWVTCTNNWNAVCLAGVTGAALALVPSRQVRAEFVAAAEKYSLNFLRGFTPDGYCSEGLGYWNYGFGHYILLSETVRQATSGRVDLLSRPAARAPAAFPANLEIVAGIYPAFADCAVNARPAPEFMYFLNRLFDMGLPNYRELDLAWATYSLPETLLFAFPNAASQAPPPSRTSHLGPRSWFPDAGVLIGRPRPGSPCRLAVAIKGGHNAEHHNHNDVGSYVVVVDDTAVLLDPGAETYTARTFSARRYESKLLNSYGHPVPVVGGRLQRPGADAKAVVRKHEFTEQQDTVVFDLSSAYEVPALEKLERTFIYSRTGAGSLTVEDRVAFSSPQTFETAMITLGEFEKSGEGIVVRVGKRAAAVAIDTSGTEYEIVAERIEEDAPVKPMHVGVRLKEPVAEATVRLVIKPLP